jgi:class 3 adenylate cyclase
MSERTNKTSICSVVFLDIADYSKMSISEQSDIKEQFNALISEAIKDVAQNDRIILDTGDGAAIALLGAPEEALFVSMTIRDNILKHNKRSAQPLFVRTGINLGPVRVVSDINGQPNIIGDGINVAQRVMSFAEPNQILVSRTYYEVTSRLTKEITEMFSYSGIKHDKHVREHEVYVIRSNAEEAALAKASVLAANAGDSNESSATTAGAQSLSKKNWVIVAVLLMGLGTYYWSAKMRTHGPEVTSTAPAPVYAPVAPAAAVALPVASQPVIAETKSPAEPKKKPVKHKKASASTADESNKGTKPDTSPGNLNDAVSHSDSNHPASHKTEPTEPQPQAKPGDKSGWDNFTKSVKQGGKKECTQGEIALHQCRN